MVMAGAATFGGAEILRTIMTTTNLATRRLSKKYTKNIPKFIPKIYQNIPKIYQKIYQQIYQKYIQIYPNISKIYKIYKASTEYQGRPARPGPSPGPRRPWYFVFILYILDIFGYMFGIFLYLVAINCYKK